MPGGRPTAKVEAEACDTEVSPRQLPHAGPRQPVGCLPRPLALRHGGATSGSVGLHAETNGSSGTVSSGAGLKLRPVPTRGVHAVDWVVLRHIREQLRKVVANRPLDAVDLDVSESSVRREELAEKWLHVVEQEQHHQGVPGILSRDKEFIEIRVGQSIRELDPKGTELVDLDEWVHHMLLTRSSPRMMRAMLQINALMEEALRQCPGILVGLQHAFEVAEQASLAYRPNMRESEGERGVLLPVRDVLGVFSRKLWHLRPAADSQSRDVAARAASAAAGEILAQDPDEFIDVTVKAMDMDLEGQISSAEFLALCLGRREQEVTLHLYDLSKGLAAAAAPWLVNQKVDGVWHTGIVVFGREYYFGGDIYYDLPSQTGFGPPRRTLVLGRTLRQREELHAYIVDELKPVFSRSAYDAARNNCNHFTDRVAMYLVGKHIPDEVLRQPELMMKTNLGRVLRPVLNRWLGLYFEPNDTAEKVPAGRAQASLQAHDVELKWGEGMLL